MSFLKGATVGFDTENNKAVYVDQTLLPDNYVEKSADEIEDMCGAVKKLKVRGAPAIGVFAAISLAVLMNKSAADNKDSFLKEMELYANKLVSCRPTAVNLKWAADRMLELARLSPIDKVRKDLCTLALSILEEDVKVCRRIGENGAELFKNFTSFLTHCNAGSLAAVRYGTALAPFYIMKEQKKEIRVFADETRPLLQGARLTAYELVKAGIDTTVICDNMASYVMKNKMVQAVVTGCDRVALNGDAANKIGTSALAVLAKYYGIPFYICMPFSTFDKSIKSGDDIVIEQRSTSEIGEMWYKKPMLPDGAKTLNPAFDVTDASLITAFITEKGVFLPQEIKNL